MDNIVRLFPAKPEDMPAMLRQMADNLERAKAEGDDEMAFEKMFTMTVNENNVFVFYGWGDWSNTKDEVREIMGLLSMAEYAWVAERMS